MNPRMLRAPPGHRRIYWVQTQASTVLPPALVRGEGYSPPSPRAYLLSDGTHVGDSVTLRSPRSPQRPFYAWLCDHRAQ